MRRIADTDWETWLREELKSPSLPLDSFWMQMIEQFALTTEFTDAEPERSDADQGTPEDDPASEDEPPIPF